MEEELTRKRVSRLSAIFRRHSLRPAKGGTGRLLNWTRHVDGDWRWYCPHCSALVIVIEEKQADAAEQGWSATRRQATHHSDRPYAAKIVCRTDGAFTVTLARLSPGGEHLSDHRERVDEDWLIRWIEAAFRQHYTEARHPERLLPVAVREVVA